MSKKEAEIIDFPSARARLHAAHERFERIEEQIAALTRERDRLSDLMDDLHWLVHRQDQR